MTHPKVLIIDDERLLVKATALALTYKGFETRGAPNGEDGLRAAVEFRPDAILLDIMMPGMDGWEVLGRLRENPDTAATPVIVFTAKEYADGSRMAIERGASDFVAKPFEPEDLATILRKHTAGAGVNTGFREKGASA